MGNLHWPNACCVDSAEADVDMECLLVPVAPKSNGYMSNEGLSKAGCGCLFYVD